MKPSCLWCPYISWFFICEMLACVLGPNFFGASLPIWLSLTLCLSETNLHPITQGWCISLHCTYFNTISQLRHVRPRQCQSKWFQHLPPITKLAVIAWKRIPRRFSINRIRLNPCQSYGVASAPLESGQRRNDSHFCCLWPEPADPVNEELSRRDDQDFRTC